MAAPLLLDSKTNFKGSGDTVTNKQLENLIPFRALNEVPSADSLLSLKLIRDSIRDHDENDEALRMISKLQANETVYQVLAMKLLQSKDDLRKRMGGYTYDNVIKLTRIIKIRAHDQWIKQFIDRNIAIAGIADPRVTGGNEVDVFGTISNRLENFNGPDEMDRGDFRGRGRRIEISRPGSRGRGGSRGGGGNIGRKVKFI